MPHHLAGEMRAYVLLETRAVLCGPDVLPFILIVEVLQIKPQRRLESHCVEVHMLSKL